jgi:hypothetical protein
MKIYSTENQKFSIWFGFVYLQSMVELGFFFTVDLHVLVQWKFSKPASTGTKKYGRFGGMAGFVRLLLQRIVRHGLKKSADIQGELVFWGSGLERFRCTFDWIPFAGVSELFSALDEYIQLCVQNCILKYDFVLDSDFCYAWSSF